MAELASNSIVAVAPPPESIAPSLAQLLVFGHLDQLVLPMSKPALPSIIAVAQLGVGLAEFGFVLEGIGLIAAKVVILLFGAVALSAGLLDV